MISPTHQQWRTIISINKRPQQVEESGDDSAVCRKHPSEATQRSNIMLAPASSSVSTSLSSEADESCAKPHVLKINISPASARPIERDQCDMMSKKPFDGNLSDDQKLVLSVDKSEIKIINGHMKGSVFDGKCSPYDDHSDSGTCSDAEVIMQPPPVPPKSMRALRQQQQMLSDSYSSASSSDSVQSGAIITLTGGHLVSPDLIRSIDKASKLPTSLLLDIRSHSVSFLNQDPEEEHEEDDEEEEEDEEEDDEQESSYDDSEVGNRDSVCYSDDSFYKFHINEHLGYSLDASKMTHDESDESFAGLKDLRSGTSTIRSAKGTIRGVKNRVRNGIATFLQMQQTTVKNYKDRDAGKVVLYTTSMGVVRSTYTKCQTVKKILNTLMIKFEERDVFMSTVHQQEIRERMEGDEIDVPQLFIDGQYIGNADQVERYNEMGELRKMLKTFKCLDSIRTCRICGGFNMLPCSSCGGSKKSIHRNSFTSEFIALKCMNCDEVGLVRCYNCS